MRVARRGGFTLIEALICFMIFSMLAVVGYGVWYNYQNPCIRSHSETHTDWVWDNNDELTGHMETHEVSVCDERTVRR
jgi:prepilin-type N-terminal cleavage/methylation domain-containing protein